MSNVFIGLSKFVVGVTLAIALLAVGGFAIVQYLMARLSEPPPRPTFPNDTVATAAAPKPNPAAPAAAPNAAAEPSPEASPTDGYTARVTEPIGLLVREEPQADSNQLDGAAFDEELIVLEDSADGGWQKVRLQNGVEGWVRSGNTEKVN
ncbi:MAG: SH3 domain-containing protein [Oculatellaceae cyanobacterium Prado106]|jgi:hypothetical protein|nr:SH3 domain-containing protein [Oculatellaceae cyanobacterium Prado106]